MELVVRPAASDSAAQIKIRHRPAAAGSGLPGRHGLSSRCSEEKPLRPAVRR